MKKLISIAAVCAVFSASAAAGPMWESFAMQVKPQDAGKIVAATDKFMNSKEGKAFGGKVILMASIANGADPTTHSYIVLNESAAAAEEWMLATYESKAWQDFMGEVASNSQPVSDSRFRVMKNWGTPNDANNVWQGHMLTVSDAAAAVAAMDKWFASDKGKQFPGEAYLSAPIAAGMTDMTHLVSVGFESEAAMEAWAESLQGNPDYTTFISEISAASEYMGATLSREVKEWGAPMDDVLN